MALLIARLAIVGALAALASPLRTQQFLTQQQALRLAFPDADRIVKTLHVVTREEATAIEESLGVGKAARVFRFWTGHDGETVLGHAVIDDAPGKARPITFVLVVDTAAHIRFVEIMAYRESHGGEVRRAGWREQFVGLGSDSALRVGQDIRNIAGATISCRSVTDGVRRNLAHLAVVARSRTDETHTEPASAEPPRDARDTVRRSRLLMGTTLEIALPASDETEIAAAAAFDEVARLERILSSWDPASEVSELSRAAGEGPRRCSTELFAFLEICRHWAEESGGALDVTAGRLCELWREAAAEGHWPDEQEIASAVRRRPIDLVLDGERGTAEIAEAGTVIDTGAVGKGFALDRAAAILRQHGFAHGLLDFGGQILVLGPRPDGTPWPIELRRPDGEELHGTPLRLAHGSLATSGDYERGRTIGGHGISHVIDPRTGRPATGLLAVTVHCDSATDADALSTALFVLGWRDAIELAERRGLAVRIHATDGREFVTDDFRKLQQGEERS